MSLFVVAMLIGGLGLVAMALLGVGFGAGGHAGHGHGGALHGGHAGHAGHVGHSAAQGAVRDAGRGPVVNSKVPGGGASFFTSSGFTLLATLASPRVLLSVLFGFGVSGRLAEHFGASETVSLVTAAIGGILFEGLLVAPFWRFLFRFASRPAETLDHAIFSAAHAVTNFDQNGNGIVKIEVDGQVVQLLATLRVEDLSTGARVHTGDELIVEEIDEVRQRCRVSTR